MAGNRGRNKSEWKRHTSDGTGCVVRFGNGRAIRRVTVLRPFMGRNRDRQNRESDAGGVGMGQPENGRLYSHI